MKRKPVPSPDGTINPGIRLSAAQLGEVIGLSSRRVNQLAQLGVFEKARNGTFDSAQAIWAYLRYRLLREQRSTADIAAIEADKRALKAAQTERAALQVGILNGDLAPRKVVQPVIERAFANFRSKMLAVPNRTADIIAKTGDPAEVERLLLERFMEAFEELDPRRIDAQIDAALKD